MQKILTIIGILFIIITIIIAILYMNNVRGVKLGYCMISMIICMVLFGVRRLYCR